MGKSTKRTVVITIHGIGKPQEGTHARLVEAVDSAALEGEWSVAEFNWNSSVPPPLTGGHVHSVS